MEAQDLLKFDIPHPDGWRLKPEQLRWTVDPLSLPFETTEEIKPRPRSFCQPRAERALKVGIQMKNAGHIFVCGPSGTDRRSLIEEALRQPAARESHGNLSDCLFAPSLDDPCRPTWIFVPPGQGRAFVTAIEDAVRAALAFARDFAGRKLNRRGNRPLESTSREFRQEFGRWLEARFRRLKSQFQGREAHRYLSSLHKALAGDLERELFFLIQPQGEGRSAQGEGHREEVCEQDLWHLYRPQLMAERIDNRPPVVFEPNPTLYNLFGYYVRPADALCSSRGGPIHFQPGSLLKANGGFLILDFEEVAGEPHVWKHLKRCLEYGILEFPILEQSLGTEGFPPRPEPIPLRTKVIAWGDEILYQDFCDHDPDFCKIFKFRADLDSQIARSEEHVEAYLQFLRHLCDEEGLPHFHRSGAAVFLEAGAELAGKQNKLSVRWEELADIAREAAFWAREEGESLVLGRHVEKSLQEMKYRRNLPEEQLQEYIDDGSILIQTEGAVVGQVNGITLYDTEDYTFGKPCRITVQTALGRSGVINIEREANLSGKIHDKGVLILCGFLRDRYAQDKPLNLSASLCLEQCYTDVDGDSASLGEVCGLLSSLAGVPLRQGIAVTGAISQKGEVQPVGGVNEKIVGFFELCRRRGFTGEQGVLIPSQNVQDLMLPADLIEAVRQGKFVLYAVQTVDQAMEILTGVPAGQRQQDGTYPPGTLNRLIDDRLWQLSRTLRDFYGDGGEYEEGEDDLLPPEPEQTP